MCSHLLLICWRFIVILGECIVPCNAIALLFSLYMSPLYCLYIIVPCNAIALLSSLYMSPLYPLYIIAPCSAIALFSVSDLYISSLAISSCAMLSLSYLLSIYPLYTLSSTLCITPCIFSISSPANHSSLYISSYILYIILSTLCITPYRCLLYIVLFISITLCNHTFYILS